MRHRSLADQFHARSHSRVAAELFLGEIQRVGCAASAPRNGDVAAIVVKRGDRARERGDRVRHRAAVLTAVHGMVERADLDDATDDAAQRRRDPWLPNAPCPRVGVDHEIAAELVLELREVRGEVLGAALLLTLDE